MNEEGMFFDESESKIHMISPKKQVLNFFDTSPYYYIGEFPSGLKGVLRSTEKKRIVIASYYNH